MKKKILFSAVLFLLAFGTISVVKIRAGVLDNVSGWSWGGSEDPSMGGTAGMIDGNESGIGWISANSLNCDANGDGASDGVGGCPPAGTPMANYGINLPNNGSAASGYAWSANVGWISFQSADLAGCPIAPCEAKRIGNDLVGWARIMSIAQNPANAGGWKGFIKLSGTLQDLVTPYGVKIDPLTGNFDGYAWSSGDSWTELGAIKMQGNTFVTKVTPAPTITLSINKTLVNIETDSFPLSVQLTWSTNNATSCRALQGVESWSPNTVKGISGTNEAVLVSGSTTFQLECTGPGGTTPSETKSVQPYCENNNCGAGGQCNATKLLGATAANQCTKNCFDNTQCEARTSGTWREIAP